MTGDHQVGAHHDASPRTLFEAEGVGQRVGADPGCPHQRGGGHHLSVGQGDVAGGDLGDASPEAHLDRP